MYVEKRALPSGVGGFLPPGPGYDWFEQFTQFEIKWLNIAHLEMYGCLQNPAVFGHLVEHKVMYDDCDNEGVYHAFREDYAHDPALQMMVFERWKPLAQLLGVVMQGREQQRFLGRRLRGSARNLGYQALALGFVQGASGLCPEVVFLSGMSQAQAQQRGPQQRSITAVP